MDRTRALESNGTRKNCDRLAAIRLGVTSSPSSRNSPLHEQAATQHLRVISDPSIQTHTCTRTHVRCNVPNFASSKLGFLTRFFRPDRGESARARTRGRNASSRLGSDVTVPARLCARARIRRRQCTVHIMPGFTSHVYTYILHTHTLRR